MLSKPRIDRLRKSTARLLLITIVMFFGACFPLRQRVPVGVIPKAQPWSQEMKQLGSQAVAESLNKYPIDNNPQHVSRVRSVLNRLFQVIDSSEQWKIYIVQNPQFNALCAPGNNIIVYSGLLETLQDDNELATVLSHEISHDLGRHLGNAGLQFLRMLSLLAAEVVGERTLQRTGNEDLALRDAKTVAILGNGLLVAPYSRDQESESDQIGVFLMAEAGFDPAKSVKVWADRAKQSNSSLMADFMGTHPPSARRAADLEKLLPLARDRYLNRGKKWAASGDFTIKNSKLIARDNPVFDESRKDNRYVSEALALMESSDFHAAKQRVTSALQISAKNVFALNGLAAIELRSGNIDKSQAAINKAIKTAPYNASSHYNLACVNALRGKKDAALDALKKAFEINPQLRAEAITDPDLSSLKSEPRFNVLINSIEQGPKSRPTFVINQF